MKYLGFEVDIFTISGKETRYNCNQIISWDHVISPGKLIETNEPETNIYS